MTAIAQGGSSSAANPLLDFYAVMPTGIVVDGAAMRPGVLVAPSALSFAIYDISDDAKRVAPVQVFPGAGMHAVDLDADKVGTGHYAAAWDCAADEALGAHEIRWTVTLVAGGPAVTFRREFDVLAGVPGLRQRGYALVSELRDEGVTIQQVSDARLVRLIDEASRYVDRVTRRFFEPRQMTLVLDGRGGRELGLNHPIVALESVATIDATGAVIPVDLAAVRVYNRHLTAGLLSPDDRDAPRLEMVLDTPMLVGAPGYYYPSEVYCSGSFPRGTQNVQVTGVFGYTDPDDARGSAGDTPAAIREAVKLLVMRRLPKLSDSDGRFEATQRHRIVSERTREQQYQLAPQGGANGGPRGSFTTDWEIDQLLEAYCAPLELAST